MSVKIIVDSTADVTPQVRSRVAVVPLTIHFGEEEFIDRVTIDSRTFYEKLIESDVDTPEEVIAIVKASLKK